MKYIFLNLKRFDVPVELGGVNRLAPVNEWAKTIVEGTQEGLKKYDPAKVEFVQFFPEAHILNAVAALCEASPVKVGCQRCLPLQPARLHRQSHGLRRGAHRPLRGAQRQGRRAGRGRRGGHRRGEPPAEPGN